MAPGVRLKLRHRRRLEDPVYSRRKTLRAWICGCSTAFVDLEHRPKRNCLCPSQQLGPLVPVCRGLENSREVGPSTGARPTRFICSNPFWIGSARLRPQKVRKKKKKTGSTAPSRQDICHRRFIDFVEMRAGYRLRWYRVRPPRGRLAAHRQHARQLRCRAFQRRRHPPPGRLPLVRASIRRAQTRPNASRRPAAAHGRRPR